MPNEEAQYLIVTNCSDTNRPRVVMMVANTVQVDGRVQKAATAVASFGYDVTLLGISTGRRRHEGSIGGAKLTLLPVSYRLRDAERPPHRGKLAERVAGLLGVQDDAAFDATRRQVKVRQRDLEARRGARKLGGVPSTSVQGAIESVQRAGLIAQSRAVTAAWERFGDSQRHRDRRGWRFNLPEMHDFELAFGPELDRLQPDIIHAHDVHLLGIAARARDRAVLRGHRPIVIYDSHEYVPGLASVHPWKIEAFKQIEDEYIGGVDRIITVSPLLAEWLERDHEPSQPVSVVLNAPASAWDSADDEVPSLRHAIGVDADTPLIVYSGGFNDTRGVKTLIDAMVELPDCHLALVTRLPHGYVDLLLEQAKSIGVDRRVHTAPFVEPHQISRYLSDADVGVHPMLHAPNHEVALPNKYFEYLHARLPVVVSDVQLMSETTKRTGVGECFTAEQPDELAAAIRRVLADPSRYVANITDELLDEFSWEHQAETLRGLYAELVDAKVDDVGAIETDLTISGIDFGSSSQLSGHERALLIGPTNPAGQSAEWARALEQFGHVPTTSMTLERAGQLTFDADLRVPLSRWGDRTWQSEQAQRIADGFSHVLFTSGRGVLGTVHGGTFADDLPHLTRLGKRCALVLHGSEVRDPARHAQREPDSPFADESNPLVEQLQASSDRLRAQLTEHELPVFVSTVDLLDDVPGATWLPPAIDVSRFVGSRPPMTTARPVVLHAPSNALLKGSSTVDAICERLDSEGLITYRRLVSVPPGDVHEHINDADIVLDQFAIGHYGVMAIQAMAAGRVVVAHLSSAVCDRLPGTPPIVRSRATSLEETLREMTARPDHARESAASGPDYVRRFHDGRLASAQLEAWVLRGRPVPFESISDLLELTDS